MNLTLEASSGKGLENLHSRWVQHIANHQHEKGKGFLVSKSGSEVGQAEADQIMQLSDVTALPVESCQHGLISLETNTYSSVLCNVPEITTLIRQGSEKILGRKTTNVVSRDTHRLFSPILQSLQFYGWARQRVNGTSMQAFLAAHSKPELCTNHARTADGIVDWLITEQLCDLDHRNHKLLSEHYPIFRHTIPQSAPTETTEERDQRRSGIAEDLRQPDPGLGVSPAELVAPAVGEDLGDEVEACLEDDYEEPSEKQKREILKLHRNLGHPQPNDFGRALRHAGMRRNLIRWAVKEMRCPVCE